jgi:hypothetical protein
MAGERILQVRLTEEADDALKEAAIAVRLENKSALVRAFADAVRRKSVREVRTFLFFDSHELPKK